MQTALLMIHIVLAVVMIGLVLLQKSEGGALGMGGGPGGFMSTRGSANLLTRTTAILAALFFASTLGLAVIFKGAQAPKSLLDAPDPTPHTAPMTPVVPAAPMAPVLPAAPVVTEAAKEEPAAKKGKKKKSTKKAASTPSDTKKTS